MYGLFLAESVDWGKVGLVIAIVAVLAVIFAILILVVSKLCAVEENETVSKIVENLAGANCGGCGYAGCEAFAKALAEGKAEITGCGPTSNENKKKIAEILGVHFAAQEPQYAVVKCAGGLNSKEIYQYVGNTGCTAQSMFLGGKKACDYGCMGQGTCEKLCPYHAVLVKNGVAEVDKALCEACGLCVKNCPKHIITLIPKTARVYVACSSFCKGKETMDACKVGCIGCGMCARNCPEGAITMENNLPVIDYSKCTGCKTCVAKCPRKSIRELQ